MQEVMYVMYVMFTLTYGVEGAETEVKMRTTGFESMVACEAALDTISVERDVESYAAICVEETGA